jgi:hypothetical protein
LVLIYQDTALPPGCCQVVLVRCCRLLVVMVGVVYQLFGEDMQGYLELNHNLLLLVVGCCQVVMLGVVYMALFEENMQKDLGCNPLVALVLVEACYYHEPYVNREPK